MTRRSVAARRRGRTRFITLVSKAGDSSGTSPARVFLNRSSITSSSRIETSLGKHGVQQLSGTVEIGFHRILRSIEHHGDVRHARLQPVVQTQRGLVHLCLLYTSPSPRDS